MDENHTYYVESLTPGGGDAIEMKFCDKEADIWTS